MSFIANERVKVSSLSPILPNSICNIADTGDSYSQVYFITEPGTKYFINNKYLTALDRTEIKVTDNSETLERINLELDTLASVIERLVNLEDISKTVGEYLTDLVTSIDERVQSL